MAEAGTSLNWSHFSNKRNPFSHFILNR
ncbi:hypothetical protein CCACVL1_17403 [Corchorus capsularis]|uniref:Uncharacterized protein n=1 Tax=Corchorus capsularis TaxID=210143 RepID=A0A1R3HS72_COCAP|nr:hypothetical protein CCACVL1_17403 [Corchorus capsularis]